MSARFSSSAGLVTRRPKIALAILAALTAVFAYGMTLLAPQAGYVVVGIGVFVALVSTIRHQLVAAKRPRGGDPE